MRLTTLALAVLLLIPAPVEAFVSRPGAVNWCEVRRDRVARWYKRHPHREHRRWPNPAVVGWFCPA